MSTDRWQKMMDRQEDFQHTVAPIVGQESKVLETKELGLGLVSELDELLRQIAWKAKRRSRIDINENNVKEEITDLLKIVMAIAVTWDISAASLYQSFMEKSEVVEQRYAQEFPLYEIISRGAKVVALDIDGVLTDWPFCFYDFIRVMHPALWISMEPDIDFTTQNPFDALPISPIQIRALKYEYRDGGYKRHLRTVEGSVAFTQKVREKGYKIVLVTSREYSQHSRIFSDTLFHLNAHEFAYDAIMWSDKKEERLLNEFDAEQIAVFVDDDPANVDRVKKCGVHAVLLDRMYNEDGVTFEEILEGL